MFIGHFGVGFAAKRVSPRVSLGTAFLAAQFLDLLWPTFLLVGLESVRIAPGATAVTPLIFDHYPISHGLAAVMGWALALGAVYALATKNARGALVVGALVVSHWLLDAIVHVPDLPLMPGAEMMVGLGLWQSKAATMAVEIPIFAAGVWLYATSTRAKDKVGNYGFIGLAAFLALIYVGNLFGEPPPSVTAIAWLGQAQWLLVAWAYWVDAHRDTSR
ncbi:hypothetical protein [Caenimonas soli]|uniref:hypothetical protein n=1 Tax=Caenimonas soli TaxID=2735555 RepID=UPI001552BB58|nr:hypothetical protein [Caenimonas soli]NPC54273.1 hypothetical protein [Caenimonas soli]